MLHRCQEEVFTRSPILGRFCPSIPKSKNSLKCQKKHGRALVVRKPSDLQQPFPDFPLGSGVPGFSASVAYGNFPFCVDTAGSKARLPLMDAGNAALLGECPVKGQTPCKRNLWPDPLVWQRLWWCCLGAVGYSLGKSLLFLWPSKCEREVCRRVRAIKSKDAEMRRQFGLFS